MAVRKAKRPFVMVEAVRAATDEVEFSPEAEDAELLANWDAGPGAVPTADEGRYWLSVADRFPRRHLALG